MRIKLGQHAVKSLIFGILAASCTAVFYCYLAPTAIATPTRPSTAPAPAVPASTAPVVEAADAAFVVRLALSATEAGEAVAEVEGYRDEPACPSGALDLRYGPGRSEHRHTLRLAGTVKLARELCLPPGARSLRFPDEMPEMTLVDMEGQEVGTSASALKLATVAYDAGNWVLRLSALVAEDPSGAGSLSLAWEARPEPAGEWTMALRLKGRHLVGTWISTWEASTLAKPSSEPAPAYPGEAESAPAVADAPSTPASQDYQPF